VLRTLRAEGVDVVDVEVCAGETTGMAFFDTAPGGARRVHYRRSTSAARGLAPAQVLAALRRGCRILHVTGITPALGPLPRAAVAAAVAAADELGVLVSLDVNFRAKLWTASEAADALRPLLPHVSVMIASEAELPLVTGARSEETQVKELLGLGIDEVVVKRGDRGADRFSSAERHTAPAVRVPVVDAVGAGDAFTAGYLSGLLDDLPPYDRLLRAVTLGAAAVASPGDWEGLPSRQELTQIADDEVLR
jgi:2-dehydro-3-deoxygluconokinase